jgi:DeoR/GlpR family transcriptional regulator of sugar metabolism
MARPAGFLRNRISASSLCLFVSICGSPMKRRLRLKQILELLQDDPELALQEACERMNASPATIRRAFVELEQTGQVERTWGGIRLAGPGALQMGPPAFAKRLEQEIDAKRAIARAAAELLKDGDVVMIDGGTTTFQLAEFIALKRIRVITNSLVIAQAIDRLKSGKLGAEVYLAGGLLEPESGLVVGTQAEEFIRRYRAQWAFLGAAGIDVNAVTNYNETVLASEKLMITQAEKLVVLADHSKIGRQAMCELCTVEDLDHLFTQKNPGTAAILRQIGKRGVSIHQT